MSHFRNLLVYQKAFALAMEVFEISKTFPSEEKYALTDQSRRASRAVCSNIAEGYRKRRYPAHFIAKCTDADGENSETQVWLAFACRCRYISEERYSDLISQSEEIGRLLNDMISHPGKYS